MFISSAKSFFYCTLLFASLIFILPDRAAAVPASSKIHVLTQPDGYSFQARQWGDEYHSGWRTAEGYSVLFDETLGSWSYAVNDSEGNLVSSSVVVGAGSPPTGSFKALPAGKALQRVIHKRSLRKYAPDNQQTLRRASAPAAGTRNIVVILMNFSDTTPTYTAADFETVLFGTGNHSLSDYYKEVSFSRLTVSSGPGGISGWFTAEKTHDYYGANSRFETDVHADELVSEAVKQLDASGFDFSAYDQDNDCYVDTVAIFFQGEDEAMTGIAGDIWPHQFNIPDYETHTNCSAGGRIKVSQYIIQSEKTEGLITTIGTIAHEFGHALGLPDLYDTDYSSYGVGRWSLMAYGNDNKVTRSGDRPAHPDAWSRYFLGWITPVPVRGTGESVVLGPVETSGTVYQLMRGTPASGEYFLLENRQKKGFDEGLPASGLLIWHIDGNKIVDNMRLNSVNDSECKPGWFSCAYRHYGVSLVQADNRWDIENNLNAGDSGDPYPGRTQNTSLGDTSSPPVSLYSGVPINITVSQIATSGDDITATLSGGECEQATLTASGSDFILHTPVVEYYGSFFLLDLTLAASEEGIIISGINANQLASDKAGCSVASLDPSLILSSYDFAVGSMHFTADWQLRSSGNRLFADILSFGQLP